MNPLAIIKQSKGRFISVTYKNKRGELKKYTVRTGVKKYLVGGTRPEVPNSITVFSLTEGQEGYKTFLFEGIKEIRFKGNTVYRHP